MCFLRKFVPLSLFTVYDLQVCVSSIFFNDLCYKSSLAILNGVNIILCYLAKAFFGLVWFGVFNFVIPSFRATFYSHLHTHIYVYIYESLDSTLPIEFRYINSGCPVCEGYVLCHRFGI